MLSLKNEALSKVSNASSLKELEDIRLFYLGKSGVIKEHLKQLSSVGDIEQRKALGATVNEVYNQVKSLLQNKKDELLEQEVNIRLRKELLDLSIPIRPKKTGKVHPLSQVLNEVKHIFYCMGFSMAEGPELEDEFHVFDALNTPAHHPARKENDTFYLKDKFDHKLDVKRIVDCVQNNAGNRVVLRTHTTSVQVRTLEQENICPPIKMVAPGRVYRNDWDATHSPMFHQIDGLYLDVNVNMGHLKFCINSFLNSFFGRDIKVRFRNSFFPFTEPSAEVDISHDGVNWLEILGCGMVHPNVLTGTGIDPAKYRGFAFGIGIERITMLKYGISDLRNFYNNNISWISHYGFCSTDLRM